MKNKIVNIKQQNQVIYADKKKSKKFLEDGASGCASDDIEQLFVKILFKYAKLH